MRSQPFFFFCRFPFSFFFFSSFPFQWCLPDVGGSTDPCDESYCGSAPFSEACVKVVADYVTVNENIVAAIDFHSYSQMWVSRTKGWKHEREDWHDRIEQQKQFESCISRLEDSRAESRSPTAKPRA